MPGRIAPRRLIESSGPETGLTNAASDRSIDLYRDRFLSAEEQATGRLMSFYAQARMEIEDFLRTGDLTPADANFYRALQAEVERAVSTLDEGARKWIDETIPTAFHEAAQTQAPGMEYTVLHDQAVKALGAETLDLIRQTSAGIRRAVQQQIAAGMLEGLSGRDLRARIVATGLQPGRWRSVEERAGVIARTETMRAYNAGSEAAQRATGALACVWIASPDEATCPICAPLDRKSFVLPGVTAEQRREAGIPDSWEERPPLPRHPRCRCTSRAQYRDDAGKMLRQAAEPAIEPAIEPAKPEPPAGGVVDQVAEFDRMRSELRDYYAGAGNRDVERMRLLDEARAAVNQNPATAPAGFRWPADVMKDFGRTLRERRPTHFGDTWRTREFTREQLATIAADLPTFRGFLAERYGVDLVAELPIPRTNRWGTTDYSKVAKLRFDAKKYPPEIRLSILTGLERWRAIDPAYVVDSEYLKVIALGGTFRPNALAWMSVHGEMRVGGNLIDYLKPGSLRGGATVSGAEEIIVHEAGHAVQNRYGAQGHWTPVVEPDATVWRDWMSRDWMKWGKGSRAHKYLPKSVAAAQADVERALARVEESRALLRAFGATDADLATSQALEEWYMKLPRWGSAEWHAKSDLGWRFASLERAEKALAEARAAETQGLGNVDYFPTDYAETNAFEDWAETTMMYLLNPAELQRVSPSRYEFMRDRVFRGKEVQP